MADLQILEARALASLGESTKATTAVSNAERTFQRVKPENEPEWARFIDPAYLFGEAATCFKDIGDTTQIDRFAGESAAEAARQRRARRGALSHASLAVGELTKGHVEEAASRGLQVVALAGSVDSSRGKEAVRDLRTRLAPYSHLDQVQEFNEQARRLLTTA